MSDGAFVAALVALHLLAIAGCVVLIRGLLLGEEAARRSEGQRARLAR